MTTLKIFFVSYLAISSCFNTKYWDSLASLSSLINVSNMLTCFRGFLSCLQPRLLDVQDASTGSAYIGGACAGDSCTRGTCIEGTCTKVACIKGTSSEGTYIGSTCGRDTCIESVCIGNINAIKCLGMHMLYEPTFIIVNNFLNNVVAGIIGSCDWLINNSCFESWISFDILP